MEVQTLRRQGRSLGEIASETGMAVTTIRKYLVSGAPERKPREPVVGKLEPFKAFIQSALNNSLGPCRPRLCSPRDVAAIAGIKHINAVILQIPARLATTATTSVRGQIRRPLWREPRPCVFR